MNSNRTIRVLIVDDSALVRKLIVDALSRDPEIEVVGTACDPYAAREKILALRPDVLTLDIEMPRMDGLTFLRILQQQHPLPVVIISSLTAAGSRAALAALEAGAVDVLAKPTSAFSIGHLAEQLPARVKGAATARRVAVSAAMPPSASSRPSSRVAVHARQLIVFGASTGGTEALKQVLTQLPGGLPGICIVQHIPALFSKAFADRLNDLCAFEVREAVDGDEPQPGLALIAPGDYHMLVHRRADHYRVSLKQGPLVHHTRPAVDLLFTSAAECAGPHATAILLTGMGRDGALGMQRLKAAGACTIAQNEETCVVYGMPRAAVELGVVDHVLPLDRIPGAILQVLRAPRGVPSPKQPAPGVRVSPPNRNPIHTCLHDSNHPIA